MAIKDYEFWFIVGTQHLYGEEIFADINSHAQDMCDEWSKKLQSQSLFSAFFT